MRVSYKHRFEPRADEPGLMRADVTSRRRVRDQRGAQKKQQAPPSPRGLRCGGVVAIIVVVLLAWFGSGQGSGCRFIDAENIGPPRPYRPRQHFERPESTSATLHQRDAADASHSGSTASSVQATVSHVP